MSEKTCGTCAHATAHTCFCRATRYTMPSDSKCEACDGDSYIPADTRDFDKLAQIALEILDAYEVADIEGSNLNVAEGFRQDMRKCGVEV